MPLAGNKYASAPGADTAKQRGAKQDPGRHLADDLRLANAAEDKAENARGREDYGDLQDQELEVEHDADMEGTIIVFHLRFAKLDGR